MNGNKASIDGIASFLNSGENPGNTGMKTLLDHAQFFPVIREFIISQILHYLTRSFQIRV